MIKMKPLVLFRNYKSINLFKFILGDWGLGIGDLGVGVWGQNPKSQIPNPQSPIPIIILFFK